MEFRNSVRLERVFGNDVMVAEAAWASTQLPLEKRTEERVRDLIINKLKSPSGKLHESPFRHPQLQFIVTGDIASHIHMIKHRVGVEINSESARYRELKEDRYYIPEDWPNGLRQYYKLRIEQAFRDYHAAISELVEDHGFSRKRAKESARYFLKYGTQLDWMVTMSFQSLMHFVNLRHSPDAQIEISKIGESMLRSVWESRLFPFSLEAWGYPPEYLEKKFSKDSR